jgi:hypothetical protein
MEWVFPGAGNRKEWRQGASWVGAEFQFYRVDLWIWMVVTVVQYCTEFHFKTIKIINLMYIFYHNKKNQGLDGGGRRNLSCYYFLRNCSRKWWQPPQEMPFVPAFLLPTSFSSPSHPLNVERPKVNPGVLFVYTCFLTISSNHKGLNTTCGRLHFPEMAETVSLLYMLLPNVICTLPLPREGVCCSWL